MWVFFILSLGVALGELDILEQEMQNTQELIDQLRTHMELLTKLKDYNAKHNITLTADVFASGSGNMMNNMIEKMVIELDSPIIDLDLMQLRPIGPYQGQGGSSNLAIVITHDNGFIDIWDTFGELIFRYAPDSKSIITATTTNHEHIKFITLGDDRIIRVHAVEMERARGNFTDTPLETVGLQTHKVNMTVYEESVAALFTSAPLDLVAGAPIDAENTLFEDESVFPTSAQFYSKSGKKFWVVADSLGGVSLHQFNGTLERRGETENGHIYQLDRHGQSVVYATSKAIGLFNLGSMETYAVCPSTTSPFTGVHIDQTRGSNILYGTLENGDIICYDMKVSESKCKPLAKFHHKQGSPQLTSIKGSVVAWSGDALSFYNTSFMETKQHKEPIELEFEGLEGEPFLQNHRLPGSGNLMVLGVGNQLRVMEVMSSYYGGDDDWFGSFRIIVIVLAVALVIGWNIYNRRSKGNKLEQQARDIQQNFEQLNRNMDDTRRMSSEVNRRVSNASRRVNFANQPTIHEMAEEDDSD